MRPNIASPGVVGGPVVTTTTVHLKETTQVNQYPAEETDFYYTKERLSYIGLIKTLGFVAVAVAIASIVLASIHVANYGLPFAIWLLVAACFFFIGALLSVYWSMQAAKSFKSSDLFQPQLKEGLSHNVFILALLLAGAAAASLVHLFMESEYSPDYAVAQTTDNASWDDAFGDGRTLEGVNSYFRKHFIIQSCFVGFFFFYFLLVARASFSCLKFGNQAMSYVVFLGSFFLLVFALGLIYFADYAFEYEDYPQLRAHFPVWNIRGLYFVGIALVAVSVIGFLIDHRSWRVGFFVLAFLLLILLVILVTFTGFAYRHTRQTYEYYKNIEDGTCRNRLDILHSQDIEDYGCPNKYVSWDQCPTGQRLAKWEFTSADNTGVPQQQAEKRGPQQTTTVTTTTTTTAATPDQAAAAHSDALNQAADNQNQAAANNQPQNPPPESYAHALDDDFTFLAETDPNGLSCLNTKCCGLMGQLYSNHLIILACFGLLATIAASYVSIGCYYFWYVTWVDAARDKRRDFAWLGLMGAAVLAFIIIFFTVNRYYINERLGDGGRHLEMLFNGW